MLITPAFAQTASTAASGASGMVPLLLQFALIGLVFWLFIIRPQNKRMKEHKAKIAAAKKGDTVVTGGGIVGKVSRVIDDNYIEVEIAANTKIRVVKSTLTDVLDATGTAAND